MHNPDEHFFDAPKQINQASGMLAGGGAREGTHKCSDKWCSGFYRIALTAGVPLGMACIDYVTKEVRLVRCAMLRSGAEADWVRIRDVYRDGGERPQSERPIDFTVAGPKGRCGQEG